MAFNILLFILLLVFDFILFKNCEIERFVVSSMFAFNSILKSKISKCGKILKIGHFIRVFLVISRKRFVRLRSEMRLIGYVRSDLNS